MVMKNFRAEDMPGKSESTEPVEEQKPKRSTSSRGRSVDKKVETRQSKVDKAQEKLAEAEEAAADAREEQVAAGYDAQAEASFDAADTKSVED